MHKRFSTRKAARGSGRLRKLKRAARQLTARRIAVLPIKPAKIGNPNSGKAPAADHGYKSATTDVAAVNHAFEQNAQLNLAVVTGRTTGLLCLDIDIKRGGFETLKKLQVELGPLLKTWSSKTGGGGRHYFFEHPRFPVGRDTAGKLLGPGIDLLGDASYAVVPPSNHASGASYRWRTGRSPDECELAPLPRPWRDHLKRRLAGRGNAAATGMVVRQPPADEVWIEGTRNTMLAAHAGVLRRRGLGDSELVTALHAENAARCKPPLDSTEVAKIGASIAKYPAATTGPQNDLGRLVAQRLLDEHYNGGEHLLATDGQFMRYRCGVWLPLDRQIIEQQVLGLLPSISLPSTAKHSALKREVVDLLMTLQVIDGDRFRRRSDPLRVINCRNGQLWLLDDAATELRPHRPETFLEHQLALDYDPEATCPLYEESLREIFGRSEDIDGMVRHWDELFGYIVQPEHKLALIVILLGTGGNGKTKLVETIVKLLGRELVYSGRVQDLEHDRFALGHLLGKRLFLDDDVQAGIKLPDGALKKISERKLLTGEFKFREKFQFESRAVPVLLCNNVPSLPDLSHGMLRRLQVIPFRRKFSAKRADPNLFDRIWASELSGILNRAIEGWQRLQRRGHFRLPRDILVAQREWRINANPLEAFLAERCAKDPTGAILVSDFYEAYCDWIKEAGITRAQQRLAVKRNLEHLGFKIVHCNRGNKALGVRLQNTSL